MEDGKKSKIYEAIPAKLFLPMAPIPADGGLPERQGPGKGGKSGGSKPVLIRGLKSLTGSVNSAHQKAQGLLAECRRAIKARDFATFLDHLDDHPDLVEEPWVRDTLHKLAKQKRLRRRRGRSRGSFALHPLWVAGLVTRFIESGEATSTEEALQHLADLGVLSYDSAKDSYYRALADSRFRAILLLSPPLAERLREEEFAAAGRVLTLRPGTSITTTGTSASGETVEITFTAEPE